MEGTLKTAEQLAAEKQLTYDKRYLRMAKIWAENSYAVRAQVGCLVVKNNSIISDGYNGTPKGFPNVCEWVPDHIRPEQGHPESLAQQEKWLDSPLKVETLKAAGVELKTRPYVLHAEANALTKLARSTNSSEGATIYVTMAPCYDCAKLIIQAGIKRVVYQHEYREKDAILLLERAGVEVVQIDI